eukprot:COSAG03_NODE_762_length_5962_cov_4.714481_1_plen_282_part_00
MGLCACNTPEGTLGSAILSVGYLINADDLFSLRATVNLMRSTADINSVVSAARERLLKDKFFRIATSLFEQSAVDRLIADPSASKTTCRQVASRHRKIWARSATHQCSFIDDIENQYILLDNAISQDDVEQVEACVTNVRNRLCHHLRELRSHITWLKAPTPSLYEGEWSDDEGASMRLECTGSSICMSENGETHASLGACRTHFTVQLSAWGGRGSFSTFRRTNDDVLEEHSSGMTVRIWYRRGAPVDKGSALPVTTPKKRTRSTGVLRTPRRCPRPTGH